MTEYQFLSISEWQKQTFGEATALSKIAHLKEEIEELESDLRTNNIGKTLEFADAFILLFGAAASDGMSYDDICFAIDEKMSINRNRKWGKPQDNGVVKHIE